MTLTINKSYSFRLNESGASVPENLLVEVAVNNEGVENIRYYGQNRRAWLISGEVETYTIPLVRLGYPDIDEATEVHIKEKPAGKPMVDILEPVPGLLPDQMIVTTNFTMGAWDGEIDIAITTPPTSPDTITGYEVQVFGFEAYSVTIDVGDMPYALPFTPEDFTQWTFGTDSWTAGMTIAAITAVGTGPMSAAKDITISQQDIYYIDPADWSLTSIQDEGTIGGVGAVDIAFSGGSSFVPPSPWVARAYVGALPSGADAATLLPLTWATEENTVPLAVGQTVRIATDVAEAGTAYGVILLYNGTKFVLGSTRETVTVLPLIISPPGALSVPVITGLSSSIATIGVALSGDMTGGAAGWSGETSRTNRFLINSVAVGSLATDAAASYTPVAGDDGKLLSLRSVGINGSGSTTTVTTTYPVRYAPPTAAGTLANVAYETGSGVQTILAATIAAAFSGSNRSYNVDNASVCSINNTTGQISVLTTVSFSGLVTVTATNSGGSVTRTFTITIAPVSIPSIADDLFDFIEVVDADGQTEGKIKLTIGAATVPAGYQIRRGFKVGQPLGAADLAGTAIVTANTTTYSSTAYADGTVVYCALYLRNTASDIYYLQASQVIISVVGFPAAPTGGTLATFSASDRSNLIGRTLIDYGVTFSSGINTAFFSCSPVMLALNSAAGSATANIETDARLKLQLEYWCDNAHVPDGRSGYRAQHQLGAYAAIIVTKIGVSRVWNALSATNRSKLDFIVRAGAFGSAIITATNNPSGAIQTRKDLLGATGGNAPNFINGMLGNVMLLVPWAGSTSAASSLLNNFDITAFKAEATTLGLTKINTAFASTSNGLTQAQSQAAVRNWTAWHNGQAITNISSHWSYLQSRNFIPATNGLNAGVGIRTGEGGPSPTYDWSNGRGKKSPGTADTTATKMCAEFNTTNGVAAGISTATYLDAAKRSAYTYATTAYNSLYEMIAAYAIAGMWAYPTFRDDMHQCTIDYLAKSAGWLNVANITLSSLSSTFGPSDHTSYGIVQRDNGWNDVLYPFVEPP